MQEPLPPLPKNKQIQPPVTPSSVLTYAVFIANLQAVYDGLRQEIRGLESRLAPVDTYAAVVEEKIKQGLATTPPPQALTIKTSPFQELPPELLQWMGRVEGLIISLQEEVKILHLKATPYQNSVPNAYQNSVPNKSGTRSTPRLQAGVARTKQRTKNKSGTQSGTSKRLNKDDEIHRVGEYIQSHKSYTITEIMEAFGMSRGTAQRRIKEAKEKNTFNNP